MNMKVSTNRKLKRMFVNILSIVVILAMAFPVTGNVHAQEPALPVGWHDGVEGIVNAGGCGAFGWTVDPDDPDRDLQVQILADGSPVATTTADLFRQDLGACTEGTCGFGINLWGLISPGVEHLISAQAYDQETSTWVDLSGTPKAVTCWGYPEGFHDGVEGVVEANSCSASGWAADPDNRDRDLQVQILADGNLVAETTANLLRPDVGACTEGTCGFGVDLWELISPDTEHQILAQAFDEETGEWWNLEATPKSLTCLTPPPPNPYIEAFAWFDRYSLADWPTGIQVDVTIENPDYQAEPFTPDGSSNWYDFIPEIDLQPGSVITATNGEITKVLTISTLGASVDAGTGIVTGNATSDRTFHMRTDGDHFQLPIEQDITADSGGSWNTTITDYLPWEWFTRGEMWEGDDDGDVTYAIWHVQQNVVEVWLAQNEIRALGWPRNTDLEFYVDGTYLGTAPTQPVDWYEGTWAVLNAGDFGVQLEPGMEVMVTDGIAPKSTTIQDLKITYANPGNDTVYGYAQANADLELGSWEDSPVFRFFNNGDDTNWMVDYKEPSLNGVTVDLNPGDELRLFMRDDEKDATVWETSVPNPFIAVSLTQHWFWVNNFMPGTLVTFYIYDNKGDENTIFEFSRNTDDFGNVNIEGWEHLWNPEPGDYVVATDGSNTKDLELEYITLDVFDPENDRVSGYALPGREVGVGVGNETGEQWMSVYTNDSTGEWVADFTLEGFEFDITEDSWAGGNVNDEDGDVTAAHNSGPSEPPAWFTVFPEQDAVEAWNWPLGALVHMAIDDPSTEATPDYEQDETITFTPWGSWQLWAWFDFAGVYDVKPGDIVTLSYGDTVRTHVVRNLAITKANHEDDIVKGTADAGAEIHVWPHATGQEQLAITNPQGKWNVDFTGIYDLKPRDGGRAEIRDEMGNATAIDWYIPEPRFTIYPDAQWFDGNDWPDGATVRITVKDKPKCTFTQESWGRFFNGNFPDGCIVTAGDRVTFTDGTIIRKHTVRNLAITKIDKEANTVMGIADTGAVVHAWVWNSDGSTLDGSNLYVTAVDGMWQADFGALGINLEIGMGIQAEIQDENGNTTSVDLNVPNTRIVASITEDWFYLADFIPGATLDLSIYEIKDGSLIWSNDEMTADVNGFAWIDSEGWNLQPGNYLVASDGNTAKDLVVEGFTFDTFNLANGQLSGTAPSGRNVWVGIGFQDQDAWTMNVTADSGTWLADFGQPVPSDYWWVAAQIFDADGDASELRPASQIIFLRPSCGSTYTVQAGSPLEIRYGSWIAIGEALAIQNAEHLTVELVLNGETVTGVQQPVVPRSEIPCGMPLENAYGVFYVTYVDPLSPGTYIAEVTWILDIAVTDGYDADGDGEPEWYGPGEIFTHEFTIIVP